MVSIDLRTADGVAELHAFALPGVRYALDPAKLSFWARPYNKPDAPSRRIDANIGEPAAVMPEQIGGGLVEYAMPVRFHPGLPRGLYSVVLKAAIGFARTPSGETLEYGDWTTHTTLSFEFWWRGAGSDSVALPALAKRLVGKPVYGYGGLSVGCPHWINTFAPEVPVVVRAVGRDRDDVAELWTGSTTHWGNDKADHFFVLGPVRVVVTLPTAKPLSVGGSNQATSDTKPCPAILLADFQLDTILSTRPPSADERGSLRAPDSVTVGMTRREVAWSLGYPTGYLTLGQLNQENVWYYREDLLPGYTVEFKNDRVTSFVKPQQLP